MIQPEYLVILQTIECTDTISSSVRFFGHKSIPSAAQWRSSLDPVGDHTGLFSALRAFKRDKKTPRIGEIINCSPSCIPGVPNSIRLARLGSHVDYCCMKQRKCDGYCSITYRNGYFLLLKVRYIRRCLSKTKQTKKPQLILFPATIGQTQNAKR